MPRWRFRPTVEVFDPLKGEDYRFQVGNSGELLFSSLECDCLVVRISWMRAWFVNRILISKLAPSLVYKTLISASASGTGFVCVSPTESFNWCSELFSLSQCEYGDSLLLEFPLIQSALSTLLNEIDKKAKYGEWLIGSYLEKSDPLAFDMTIGIKSEQTTLNLDYWLARFSEIGSLWAFDFDSGELLAIVRTGTGLEGIAKTIIESCLGET